MGYEWASDAVGKVHVAQRTVGCTLDYCISLVGLSVESGVGNMVTKSKHTLLLLRSRKVGLKR